MFKTTFLNGILDMDSTVFLSRRRLNVEVDSNIGRSVKTAKRGVIKLGTGKGGNFLFHGIRVKRHICWLFKCAIDGLGFQSIAGVIGNRLNQVETIQSVA